ncbi:MAG: sensor histidine kinase [Ktedonobacterales bacterium]
MRKGAMHRQSVQSYGARADLYAIANTREAVQHDLTRELHDTVIQPLTSLLISFTQAERQLLDTGDIEGRLDMWKGLAQEALDSLRSSLAGLREPSYQTDDLPESLRSTLIPQFSACGLKLNLEDYDWPPDLPPHWNSHLYLAVREAVMNAQKHAHASQVNIQLRADPHSLVVTIGDNGVGFPQTDYASERRQRPGCGLGINSIRERVTLLGGQMTLSSTPGLGVEIEIQLPRPQPTKRLISCASGRSDGEFTFDRYIH